MKNITLTALILFSLLQIACKDKQQQTSVLEEIKQELIKVATKENKEFEFSSKMIEEDNQIEVTLSNKNVGKQVVFNAQDTSLLLGYHAKKMMDATKAEITKFEIIKKDKVVSLRTSDGSGQILSENKFVVNDKVLNVDSINRDNNFKDCVDDFFCDLEAPRCEANRTCETQYYAIFCCNSDEDCISIHYVFEPENPFSCLLRPRPIDMPVIVAK